MNRIIRTSTVVAGVLMSGAVFAQPAGSTGALPPEGAPDPSAAPGAAPPPAAPAPAPTQPPPPQPGVQPAAAAPGAQPGAQPPPYAYPAYPAYPPPAAAPPPEPKPEARRVSLTFSPIHLLFPVFELNAEVRVVDHFGLAAIGGIGSITAETTLGESEKFSVYELGAQAIAYPLDAFDGLEVGAELLYVKVKADNLKSQNIRGVGEGMAIGPMIGYKLLTKGGFTFVVQGGLEYVALRAEANDTSGNQSTASDSRWIPLLNLNLGWSF